MFKKVLSLIFLSLIHAGCMSSGRQESKSTSPNGDVTIKPFAQIAIPTSGYALPTNIDVVPDNTVNGEFSIQAKAPVITYSSGSHIISSKSTTEQLNPAIAETDLQKDSKRKRLEIWTPGLNQFEIINTLLKVLAQTRYEDARNLNNGPYTALIKFEEKGSVDYQNWVIDSQMVLNGVYAENIVNVWIKESESKLIKARFRIEKPATDLQPYGQWNVDANMIEDNVIKGHFLARVAQQEDGTVKIVIRESDMGGNRQNEEVKGLLFVNRQSGHGIVQYPEYANNSFEIKNVSYGYNDKFVSILSSDNQKTCLDREKFYDVVTEYGVYDKDGNNLKRTKNFGMPLELQNGDLKSYLYYGQYKGIHNVYNLEKHPEINIGSVVKARTFEGKLIDVTFKEARSGHLEKQIKEEIGLNEITGVILRLSESGKNVYRYFENKGWFLCLPFQNLPIENCASNLFPGKYDFLGDPNTHENITLLINGQRVSFDNNNNLIGFNPIDGMIMYRHWSRPLFLKFDGTNWLQYSYQFLNKNDWEPQLLSSSNYQFKTGGNFYANHGDFSYQFDILLPSQIPTNIMKGDSVAILPTFNQNLNLFSNGKKFHYDAAQFDLWDEENNRVTSSLWHLEDEQGQSYSWVYDDGNHGGNSRVHYLSHGNNLIILEPTLYFRPVSLDGQVINLGFDGHIRGITDARQYFEKIGSQYNLEDIKNNLPIISEGTLFNNQVSDEQYTLIHLAKRRVFNVTDNENCPFENENQLSFEGEIPEFRTIDIGQFPEIAPLKVSEGVFI